MVVFARLPLSFLAIFAAIVAVISFAFSSHAKPTHVAQTDHARFELIIDQQAAAPGASIWALIRFELSEGWHIYWQNPGDSGLPAELNWQLPEGWSAGPIHWPPPKRIEYSGLFNYGFEGTVSLLVPLTIPESWQSAPATIAVDVNYLICADICIPEEGTLQRRLTPEEATSDSHKEWLSDALAELPKPFIGRSEYDFNRGNVYLGFEIGELAEIERERIYSAWFFPLSESVLSNADEQQWRIDGYTLILSIAQEGNARPDPLQGVLEMRTTDGQTHHYFTKLTYAPAEAAGLPTSIALDQPDTADETGTGTPSLWLALGLAFLGGIILNVMPCVLPVLSLKALSIAKSSQKNPAMVRKEGLAYTLGIVFTFLLVAGLLIILQQGGELIGWGFQLQSPVFVGLLCYILFAVGLNLSGLLSIQLPAMSVGISQSGTGSSFFTGVLATVVATPCTAPFMATALGYALTQPPAIALLIFTALGLGLAFPLLLVTFIPAAIRLLPKPGAWMETFRQLLAFPIYATLIWLIWVLVAQVGSDAVLWILGGITLIAFGAWFSRIARTPLARSGGWLGVLALIIFTLTSLPEMASSDAHAAPPSHGERFSPEKLADLRAQGRAVFVNATADWCITCKVNERVTLRDDAVLQTMADHNIAYLVADWTRRDDTITEYLASFNRNGVPLYAYYPPNGEPILLPQLLTPSSVITTLNTP